MYEDRLGVCILTRREKIKKDQRSHIRTQAERLDLEYGRSDIGRQRVKIRAAVNHVQAEDRTDACDEDRFDCIPIFHRIKRSGKEKN